MLFWVLSIMGHRGDGVKVGGLTTRPERNFCDPLLPNPYGRNLGQIPTLTGMEKVTPQWIFLPPHRLTLYPCMVLSQLTIGSYKPTLYHIYLKAFLILNIFFHFQSASNLFLYIIFLRLHCVSYHIISVGEKR